MIIQWNTWHSLNGSLSSVHTEVFIIAQENQFLILVVVLFLWARNVDYCGLKFFWSNKDSTLIHYYVVKRISLEMRPLKLYQTRNVKVATNYVDHSFHEQ